MNVTGIAAEYNPFHNGHLWQMQEARRLGGRVVVAMSGPYTQRGEGAILCKYARAEMALRCGASVVLEIPVRFACAGASSFARAAVSTLANLGVCTHLSFGAETPNLPLLRTLAKITDQESPMYKENLRHNLNMGRSFARARVMAVQSLLPSAERDVGVDVSEIMQRPNNILALEYLAAMRRYAPEIIPLPIKRKGAAHDAAVPVFFDSPADSKTGFASASYIRTLIRNGADCDELSLLMPPESILVLKKQKFYGAPLDKYSVILHYILSAENFKPYMNNFHNREHESLWRQIGKEALLGGDISQIVDRSASKRFTKARIRRAITRRILGLGVEQRDAPAYVRVLGFRKDDADLLSSITKNSLLPVITNLKHSKNILGADETAREMLGEDLRAQDLFRRISGSPGTEFAVPMVIL